MIYLNIDHSGLNKFSEPDDANFKLVRSVIEEMVRGTSSLKASENMH